MSDKPTAISEEELVFHKRLVDNFNKAQQNEINLRAQIYSAIVEIDSTKKAMAEWLNHLGDKYHLLPDDGVDADGNIQYLDPKWAYAEGQKLLAEAKMADLLRPSVIEEEGNSRRKRFESLRDNPMEEVIFEEGEIPYVVEDEPILEPVVEEIPMPPPVVEEIPMPPSPPAVQEKPQHYKPSKKVKF
jgi:hypothetical protein